MRRLQIAFHDPRLSRASGGGETLTLRTIEALDPKRFTITIVTRSGAVSPLFEQFIASHSEIEFVAMTAPQEGADGSVRALLRDHHGENLWGHDTVVDDAIRFNSVASEFYRHGHWDLVSVTVLTDLYGLDPAGQVAFHIYGCPPSTMATAEGPLLRKATAISAVSRFVRDQFSTVMNGWIESDQIKILPAGLPPAFTASCRTAEHRDVDFVFAGRLVPRKGVDLILRALARIRQDHGSMPSLIIAGDGPERLTLAGLCKELGLESQVNFTGPLSEAGLIALLDRAKWFLYPVRRAEAFGLSPLEAMARGVPPIVCSPGGMAEYVEHDRNGLILRAPDAQLLAEVMQRVCSEPDICARFEPACRQTAQRYSWAAFCEAVNRFFLEASDSRK